jgi:hypothetical protein
MDTHCATQFFDVVAQRTALSATFNMTLEIQTPDKVQLLVDVGVD